MNRIEGDKIAIPFFLLSIYYFAIKNKRNDIENILLLFSIGGFAADSYWTLME